MDSSQSHVVYIPFFVFIPNKGSIPTEWFPWLVEMNEYSTDIYMYASVPPQSWPHTDKKLPQKPIRETCTIYLSQE